MAADAGTADGEMRQTPETDTSLTSIDQESAEPTSGAGLDAFEDSDRQAEDDDAVTGDDVSAKREMSHVRLAIVVGSIVAVGLTALVGWLGFEKYQSHQAQERREVFVQVARQGALNLTTIDWQHADADVQRVLDSATGAFYDDFSKRAKPFTEVVKKAQAKSVGAITEAGLESESGDEAQVLVAVSVKTSNIGAAEQEPRAWRMRISVQKDGDAVKVSNVSFVP